LNGDWTLMDIPTSTLLLPAFSQAILIDPAAHLGLDGDYDDDDGDFLVWQRNAGNASGSLPNDPTGATIGAEQLNAWAGNFGDSRGRPAAVPEPSLWTLLFLNCLAVLRPHRAFSGRGTC
ncbi:MAG: hypothetical protein H0T51_25490, partial [Pirellulales bacterium]|nr:hypothetical protein [Pirellulales bacterium]